MKPSYKQKSQGMIYIYIYFFCISSIAAPDHMTTSSRDSAAAGSRERLLAASNQSTCQFCGLRMRRQLLVRHLADVHCVEGRAAHASTHPPDSANSDSGSETTLSGSEQV